MTNPSPLILTLDIGRAGKVSSFEAASGSMLVGSGSHCDVRLLPEEAAAEQLVLELHDGNIYGRSSTRDAAVRLAGEPFEEGFLASGAELMLGELQLRVGLRSEQKRAGWKTESTTQTTLIRVVLMAGIVFGLYKILNPEKRTGVLDQVVAAPALFPDDEQARCTVDDSREAAFQAQRWSLEATVRQERAPFYARDGVASVALYRDAEVCFRKAGRTVDAKRIERTMKKLRADLENEFHVRQVRLERFLSLKKHDQAQQEVYVLQSFLHQKDGPYVQWLAAVQRELNARFASVARSR